MYITDGCRPACDTSHTCHLKFYAYACLTSSRVHNPAFNGADGFFTHSDMAWPTLYASVTAWLLKNQGFTLALLRGC